MPKIHLEQIELENFKSFKGSHMIGPFHNFTGIVGPNGSGKSNLLDALAFALFLDPNPRSTNYIYHDPASKAPPLDSCFVRVIFSDKEGKISFERQVQSNNEMSFFYNGESVSEEDYLKSLYSFNIHPLCFVKQTEIDAIARKSPLELTQLFEEVSGSIEYSRDYDELKITANSKREELSLLEKRRRAAQTEKNHINQCKEEATMYQKMNEDLEKKKLNLALIQLYYLNKDVTSLSEACENINQEKEQLYLKIDEKKEQRKDLQERSNEIIDKHTKVDNNLQVVEQDIRKTRADLVVETERKNYYSTRLRDIQNNIRTKEQSIENWKERHEAYIKESEEIQEELKTLPDPGNLRKDLEEFNSIRAQADTFYASVANEVREATRRRDEIQSEYNQLQRLKRSNEESLERTQNELNEIIVKIEKYDAEFKVISKRVEENRLKMNRIEEENKKDDQMSMEISKELNTINLEIESIMRTLGTSKSKVRFDKAVSNLQRLVPGVYGTFSQLCSPTDGPYRTAVLSALSGSSEILIVKDREVGRRCVDYFKEQQVGSLSVIPLNNIQIPQKKHHENVQFLSNFVKAKDNKFKPVIDYVCGTVVVVDSFEDGVKMAFKKGYNVVTKDGTFIDKAGIITSGSVKEGNWNENILKDLQEKKAQYLDNLDKIAVNRENRRVEYEKIQEEISEEFQLQRIKRILDELKKNRQPLFESNKRTIALEIKKNDQEISKIQKSLEEAQNDADSALEKQMALDKELYKDFKPSTGETIQEVERRYNRRLTLESRYKCLVEGLISDSEKNNPENFILDLKSSSEEIKQNLTQTEDHMSQLKDQLAKLEKESEQLRKQKSNLLVEDESFRRELKDINRAIREYSEEAESYSNEFSALDQERRNATQDLSNVFQKCKLSGIILPTKTDGKREEEQNSQAFYSQFEFDIDVINTIDFKRGLTAAQRSYSSKDEIESEIKLLENDIATQQYKLDNIKPDLNFEEKSISVKEELDNMIKETEKATKESKEARKLFNETRDNRVRKFMALFDEVDSTIDKVYRQLTRVKNADRAGTAYLALEDSDEPYNGGIKFTAMPPHKRFRDLDQLSGGEKAVASLALVIALQKYIDAPFILMDEPDASLDKINLHSAANALIGMSDQGSQIIYVSLRERFFHFSETLFGIYRDPQEHSSGVLSLNLQSFSDQNLVMENLDE